MPATPTEGRNGPQPGLVVTHQANTVTVETGDGLHLQCSVPRRIQRPVCGDRITWTATGDDCGQIVSVGERRNVLARPHPRGGERPIAANLDRILLVIAVQPVFQEALIDRYLTAAEYFGIPAAIVLNKLDLATEPLLEELHRLLSVYADLGYPLYHASVPNNHGLDELTERLKTGNHILVGQSGVGKSSLVGALVPNQDIDVGAISEATGLGRHTTSATTLYHLPQGGRLVDSPGVRDFGLWHLPVASIQNGFVEFQAYLGQCRFRDCLHLEEPGCAVRAALDNGRINAQRMDSYRQIVGGLR